MRLKENSKSKISDLLKKVLLYFMLIPAALSLSCGSDAGESDTKDIKEWEFFRRNAEILEEMDKDRDEEEEKEKSIYEDMHLKLTVTDKGEDIFIPRKGASYDYRYGPSMLLQDDGSMDVYLSVTGDSVHELDWISCMHSDDGGSTWSDEKIVLSPTPVSKDEHSVCDPDVFYYGGFYYLGYTSTMVETNQGIANSIFLARSIYPDGPFAKWDGSGWGGDPEPVIYYDGVWNGWGVGEPSFVIVDDTIYVYSTRDAYNEKNERIRATEVHTADITDENWPAKLEFAGYTVIRTDTGEEGSETDGYVYEDCDSWDVAYVEKYDKFVAVCTNRRFSGDSCILYYESENGIYFERVSELNENVICGCHNAGIMSDSQGHIKQGDPAMIGYAYSGAGNSVWGNWATRIAPISIGITREIDRSEEEKENLKIPISGRSRSGKRHIFFITADSRVRSVGSTEEDFSVSCAWMDNYRATHGITSSDVIYSGYDRDMIKISNGVITPLEEGMTSLTVGYGGVSRQIRLKINPGDRSVKDFFSPVSSYTVSLSRPFAVAVRPMIRLKDYSIFEINLDNISEYEVTFESMDGAICSVREDGVITPLSPGETKIKVSGSMGITYVVDVCVVE